MDKTSQVSALIRKIAKGNGVDYPISAVVKSVEGDSCTVQLESGLTISDVKLKATIGITDGMLIVPKVNTNVLVLSSTGTLDNVYVIKVDEIAKLEIKQKQILLDVDFEKGTIGFENETTSLTDLVSSLVTTLKSLKVFTPVDGVPTLSTALDPGSVTALNGIETKLKSILKGD